MKLPLSIQDLFMGYQKFLRIMRQCTIEKLMVFSQLMVFYLTMSLLGEVLPFVTKKIVQGLVRIKKGFQRKLSLGNLYAIRDWGHAKDYAVSMWKILQYKKPDDWVIATNKDQTVKKFINIVARKLNIRLTWKGKGFKEKGIDKETGKIIIDVDRKHFRPTEVDFLRGDFSKAKRHLKWKPVISTNELIDDMIDHELSVY